MLVIHGWRRYGKVRQVPGVAHIATVFLHLYWVPTLPMRSYVVIEGPRPEVGAVTPLGEVKRTRYGFVGIRTRLNWSSVLMGYLRAGLGLGLFTFTMSAVVFASEAANGRGMTPESAAVAAGLAVSCGLGFWFSRWLTRAGWASGNELRADLGLPPSDEF
jgi:hypothetical protein